MATTQARTAQSRFLSLLKNSILKLDLAELDFGIYRILNYRRAPGGRGRRPTCCARRSRHAGHRRRHLARARYQRMALGR